MEGNTAPTIKKKFVYGVILKYLSIFEELNFEKVKRGSCRDFRRDRESIEEREGNVRNCTKSDLPKRKIKTLLKTKKKCASYLSEDTG